MARTYNEKAIKEQRRQFQSIVRQGQIECDHKDAKGPTLENLSDTKEFVRQRRLYGDCAVICKQCKDIFDFRSYSMDDLLKVTTIIRSAANQIKVLDNMSDQDYEKIKSIMEIADELETSFFPYYLNVIKQLTNGKGNGKKDHGRQKGRLGISSSSFSSK